MGGADQNATRFGPAKVTESMAPTAGIVDVVPDDGHVLLIRGVVEADVQPRAPASRRATRT